MKKLLSLTLILSLLFTVPTFAAEDPLEKVIPTNHATVLTFDQSEGEIRYQMIGGEPYVPLKPVLEKLGFVVNYYDDTYGKRVSASSFRLSNVQASDGIYNYLTLLIYDLDQNTTNLNETTLNLIPAPKIINGTTMFPLSFFNDYLCCTVTQEGTQYLLEDEKLMFSLYVGDETYIGTVVNGFFSGPVHIKSASYDHYIAFASVDQFLNLNGIGAYYFYEENKNYPYILYGTFQNNVLNGPVLNMTDSQGCYEYRMDGKVIDGSYPVFDVKTGNILGSFKYKNQSIISSSLNNPSNAISNECKKMFDEYQDFAFTEEVTAAYWDYMNAIQDAGTKAKMLGKTEETYRKEQSRSMLNIIRSICKEYNVSYDIPNI